MSMPYMVLPAQGSDPADEWQRLGMDAQLSNNLPLAQQRYQHALRLDPNHALATQNLAIVFAASPGMIHEGLLAMERAEMFDGVHSTIKINHAMMALQADEIDLALKKAQEALEQKDDLASWWCMAAISATAGKPEDAVKFYNKMLDAEPAHPVAGINCCFVQTLTEVTAAELAKQRERWYKAHGFKGKHNPHENEKNADRKLRIGYVGGDFKTHSASSMFRNVILKHTDDVEVYLYSSLPVDPATDGNTKKFKDKVGDKWRDIDKMSDEDAAKLIRTDKIDILVDVAAHTNGGRMALFTRKPAPVQVSAWGFAHGTGCPEVDYFFADPIAVPEEDRRYYAERIFDLPCVVTFDAPEEYQLKGESLPPIRNKGWFTFGTYTRYEKMSDDCLKTYAEIMRRVPDAKMQFKDAAYKRPYSIRRIYDLMPDIDRKRLLFSLATPHNDHMLSYQQTDMYLDSWPHGGGCVALETLYMGVPMLTRYGKQPSGRTASSVLTAMGRKDWIARDNQEFVEKAVEWSDRTKELAEARKTLRDEFLNSVVVKDYHLAVESAYKEIFKRWCSQW